MKAMNCRIDDHIVRLLQVTGFGTYQTLKEITPEDLKSIVEFVKNGNILDRVNPEDLHLYLGQCKTREKFSFVPGEAKLIKKVSEYVARNHTESDKVLGKMSLYPLFNNKAIQKESLKSSNARKKLKVSEDLVLSLDVPKEVIAIKNLLKEYCRKHNIPDLIAKDVPNLSVTVKAVETDTNAYLSANIICSICKKGQSIQRHRNETWIASNMTRHLKTHVAKGNLNQANMDSFVQKVMVQPTIAYSLGKKNSIQQDKPAEKESTNSECEDDPEELPTIDLTAGCSQENENNLVNNSTSEVPKTVNTGDFQERGEEVSPQAGPSPQ